jgi:hypothetical protein
LNHHTTSFTFRVPAPYAVVAPLFGAHEERRWAKGWDPEFIFPQPARDVEGMVFRVGDTIWINTIFDLGRGRVQYVNVATGEIVTRIDIRLHDQSGTTAVDVTYERTALTESALDAARELADADRKKAPEWESSIRGAVS